MTRFWQRRIATLLIVFSVLVLIGYGVETFAPMISRRTLEWTPFIGINWIAAIGAFVSIVIALYAIIRTHPEDIGESAIVCYVTYMAEAAIVAVALPSLLPYILFWSVGILFAPLFGVGLTVIAALIGNGYLVLTMFTGTNYTLQDLIYLFTIIDAPLILGVVAWRNIESSSSHAADTKEDRSYSAIAKQLNQIAGKSDVVIKTIGEGVLALNGKGIIELINPAAEQIVGWGDGDALNLHYKSVLKLVDSKNKELDDARDPVQIALSSNNPASADSYSLVTQSGRNLLASVVVSPVGQPGMGVIVVFRDITKEREEERQQAEFISTASHEMRTPVASIEGYLGLALNPQTAQIDAKARDFITKAHESAQHLGRLFQDLLDVSKADDSRLKNDPKLVDVVAFVRDIVEGLRPKADEKHLTLIYQPSIGQVVEGRDRISGRELHPMYYANVDNDHLREVVANLVENGIKYTPEGHVKVDVGGDENHVTISVADTGLGIPREEQPHLFQKFYRIDNTQTREIGGTGLGLYLCRRLAEAMSGRVYLESEYKKGSTFYLEIPRTSSLDASRIMQQAEFESATIESKEVADNTLPSDALVSEVTGEPVVSEAPPAAPQAQTVAAPPTPVPAAAPIVVAPQPIAYAPTPTTDTVSRFQNIPLNSLEANREQYARQIENRNLSVPPRE